MKDWKAWHNNKGEWNEPCVPARNEEGRGYCRTHGGDAHGNGLRRFVVFPWGIKGWDVPGPGWVCTFAQERAEIFKAGYEQGTDDA